jgi:hypothetical protein
VGRTEPLAVYEVVGRAGQVEPASSALLERYRRAIEHYRARRWAEAAALFAEIQASAPGDGPSALYLRRSRDLLASPPPAEWDGVYVAKTK